MTLSSSDRPSMTTIASICHWEPFEPSTRAQALWVGAGNQFPAITPPTTNARARTRRLDHRSRKRLVGNGGRRQSRSRLRANRKCKPRLLRRPQTRRRQVGELRSCAPRQNGISRLGVPARASRPLGLRHRLAHAARDHSTRWQACARRHPGKQDRVPLRTQSRYWRASLPGRRASRPAQRRPRRSRVTDTTDSDCSASGHTAEAYRRRSLGSHAGGPRILPRPIRQTPQSRDFHPTQYPRHFGVPRQSRRYELERLFL